MEVMQNMASREARMRDNPEGGDLDPADDVRRKNFSSILSCINKKTKEGCDHGSRTVHNEQDGKGQFLRKPKESGKKESYEKDFISRSYSRYASSLLGEGECCSDSGK